MSYLEYTVKTTPTGLRKVLYLNWPLIILLIAVASAGFLMLYSVAGGSFSPWAAPQMKRFALGIVLMMFVAMVPIWFWRNMSVVAYIVSLLLLVAVELVGVEGKGAQRWINLGFMRLQPSELMKIALVMVLAAYYDWLPLKKTSRFIWVVIPVILILIPVALVLKQPDLGTSILLITAGALVMFLAGVHWGYFAVVTAAVVGLVTAVFQSRGTTWQLAQRLPVPTHRHLPRSGERPAWCGIPHYAVQDLARLRRLDRAGFHAGNAIAAELPAGETHRFHLYDTGRGIRLCRGVFASVALRADRLFLHHRGTVEPRPVFIALDPRDRDDVLPLLSRSTCRWSWAWPRSSASPCRWSAMAARPC